MPSKQDEDIQRLASRMAMLASDDGEAASAGRAIARLARRLGMSGGQLKTIFLAGVAAVGGTPPPPSEQSARITALEAEVNGLRDALRRTEQAARALQRDRDSLRGETADLHGALDERRGAWQARVLAVLLVVLGVAGAGWMAVYGPRWHIGAEGPVDAAGTPTYRIAVTHETTTELHRLPDAASPSLATMVAGTRLKVHKTLWHNLEQWVEVELNGQTGYVLSNDVDLS